MSVVGSRWCRRRSETKVDLITDHWWQTQIDHKSISCVCTHLLAKIVQRRFGEFQSIRKQSFQGKLLGWHCFRVITPRSGIPQYSSIIALSWWREGYSPNIWSAVGRPLTHSLILIRFAHPPLVSTLYTTMVCATSHSHLSRI